jgi:hypothetical protein
MVINTPVIKKISHRKHGRKAAIISLLYLRSLRLIIVVVLKKISKFI